jgi:outer membrane protein assembly factor BamB
MSSSARLVTLVTAALLLAGCTDTDESAPPATSTSGSTTPAGEAPELAAAWTAVGGTQAPAVATDDLLVFVDGDVVRTLDRATGEQLSLFRGRQVGRLCSVSPQVSGGRVLGLLLDTRTSAPCTVTAALDVRTGKLRWRRTLPSSDPDLAPGQPDRYHEGRSVAVGDRTLLATTTCSEVRRLSIRDGRPLGVIAPRDQACRNGTVTDGTLVATLDYDPAPTEYPDDHGTGWAPAQDGPGAFVVYDADTGRRLWSHEVPDHTTAEMNDIVSSDPLLLTSAVHGRATTRFWDDRGRPGAYVGRSTPFSPGEEPGLRVIGRSDDLLVVSYPEGSTPGLYAYDLTSGEQRWRLSPPVQAGAMAAVDGDRLLLAVPGELGTDLLGYDLADPGTPRLLGRAEGRAVALEGDLLLTGGDDLYDGGPLTAFPAPEGDGVADYAPPADDRSWAEDDVRPEDVVNACAAVSPRTLRLAGLAWGDLPAPADCRWDRMFLPDYVATRLGVSVTAVPPGLSPKAEELTAVEAATAQAQDLATENLVEDDEPDLPELAPGTHLGDQAWGSFGGQVTDALGSHPVRMVTRWRNVVVAVTAAQGIQLEDRATALVPYDRLQDAVYAATEDVLESLGADPTPVDHGEEGPFGGVGDVCRALAPVAADLLPGGRPATGRSGDQQRACVWSPPGDDGLDAFVVVADSVPGAPDGTAAERRAVQVAQMLSGNRQRERHLEGLPGRSTIRRYVGGDYLVWDVTSRLDDLVVWVHYASYHHGTTRAEMEERTTRAMRVAVRAARTTKAADR